MDYFSSNDYELCYNKSSVDSSISRVYDLLDKIERYRLHMIDDVSSLEKNAHDVIGTSVDEDYKDFEYVLNEDGLQLFEMELKNFLRDLQGQMRDYERQTADNKRRREEEERRKREEEERKRREEEEKKKNANNVTHYTWR
jgi:hypothetical protein